MAKENRPYGLRKPCPHNRHNSKEHTYEKEERYRRESEKSDEKVERQNLLRTFPFSTLEQGQARQSPCTNNLDLQEHVIDRSESDANSKNNSMNGVRLRLRVWTIFIQMIYTL